MSEITLDQVTKVFPNGVRAVDQFSLHMPAGELLTLVGPSGSGKTTILRLIAGLETPTAGTVFLDGRPANDLPPPDRDVAMVFQRHSLYPHLDVRGNLAFGLRLRRPGGWLRRGLTRLFRPARYRELCREGKYIAERVADAARLLDLEAVLGMRPAQLSGGEEQRAALGRALVRRPAVYLLDEPLSHLDARLREEMRRQLHLLHRRERATMVYVTHDQLEAMTLGQRLGVLDRGVLRQVGTPEEVYRQPRNRFVAGFLGWPPMNFVHGRIVTRKGGRIFSAGTWDLPAGAKAGADGPVTFGIRPEHVSLGGFGPARRTMGVMLVEPYGAEQLLTLESGGTCVAVRVEGRRATGVGESVEVTFDMDHAHWFDPATGDALPARVSSG
jgi:multiple sugar transport system ATP-binding protein